MAASKKQRRSTRAMLLAVISAALHTTANAYIVESASFGQNGQIAPEGNLKNWQLTGHQFTPEILSDKVVLTPPYPGNRQGGMWMQQKLNQPEWLVDFEFRVAGPPGGQGQLQLWYTREREEQIKNKNLYNVGKFTGLALLVDHEGGPAGGIRAFLNDGTTDFRQHAQGIDHLPFAHCDYAYRNLGAFSKLQLHQDATGLEVLVDGRRCFKADGVFLPRDNYFGITANTGLRPDSVEVARFVTQTSVAVSREEPVRAQPMGGSPQQPGAQAAAAAAAAGGAAAGQARQAPPAQAGGAVGGAAAADGAVLNDIRSQVASLAGIRTTVDELKQKVSSIDGRYAKSEELRSLEAKIDRIAQMVEKISSETRDWSGHFDQINKELRTGTDVFLDKIPQHVGEAVLRHGPSLMQLVFVVIAAQLLLGLAYILYRRRQASPKKYL